MLFLTMPPPPPADLLMQIPHREEGEVRKCPTNAQPGRGGLSALGIDLRLCMGIFKFDNYLHQQFT